MGNNAKGFEFKKFATPRIIGGIAIAVIVLWALSIIFSPSEDPSSKRVAQQPHDSAEATAPAGDAGSHQATQSAHPPASGAAATGHATGTSDHGAAAAPGTTGHGATTAHGTTDAHGTTAAQKTAASQGTAARSSSGTQGQKTAAHGTAQTAAGAAGAHQPQPAAASTHDTQAGAHDTAGQAAAQHNTASGHPIPATVSTAMVHKPKPRGVAFVEATIQPLQFELEERWWGWRPNDIIDLTDNVNNFQMGVLEVTRRATVALAERISRTGSTDAFDENLEQAMNWFMIKASSYWFPSAESKYREGLEELQAYMEKLNQGNATFYTRTDNLIPLLASFMDLLGSCDENLVKQVNEDGTTVSSFAVDNYFFYTQGVASAMASVLEAVHHDFLITLESRNATELLHHAILSCHQAGEIDPWIILDSKLSSVWANHRANMAAPISHAHFYLGLLIKTLST